LRIDALRDVGGLRMQQDCAQASSTSLNCFLNTGTFLSAREISNYAGQTECGEEMEINGLNHHRFVVRQAYSARVSNFDH
jgi:hypothetical protein